MDNFKSYEFTFLYLINKCILLFKYINNTYQKEILHNIKLFINKLEEIFSNADFKDNEEKKNKILEILINYFENLIDIKIYNLLNCNDKNDIINEIEKKALIICENNEKNKNLKLTKLKQKEISSETIPYYDPSDLKYKNNTINEINLHKDDESIIHKINNNLEKSEEVLRNTILKNTTFDVKDLAEFEKKINTKIKVLFNEIENNIKLSLKEYFTYTETVEYDLDKKFNTKIQTKIEQNNELIEFRINEILTEISNKESHSDLTSLNNEIHEYINTLIKDTKKNINNDIENKIKLLGNIFNENMEKIFIGLNQKIVDNESDLLTMFEEKINNINFNKNNFNIIFDKDQNEIKLYYHNDLITSTKLNIKGLIGPKGPTGNSGEKGDTPIIRKIKFTDNNKLKFIIQESQNIYEVISDDSIPLGPQGIKGEQGDPGKSIINLAWNQENVMRIDDDHRDSLIFLKSLCVGEKSHCLKDNSLSIGGAICYNNNSIAVGQNSKTLDSESIALYGTTIGKKSYSYRADNVDENTVQFGQKDKTSYNTNSFNIISKEINLECDIFKIKTNKYENNKFKELDERIILLEKKIIEILKKI